MKIRPFSQQAMVLICNRQNFNVFTVLILQINSGNFYQLVYNIEEGNIDIEGKTVNIRNLKTKDF